MLLIAYFVLNNNNNFVSDIAVFVLERDVKLQSTNPANNNQNLLTCVKVITLTQL